MEYICVYIYIYINPNKKVGLIRQLNLTRLDQLPLSFGCGSKKGPQHEPLANGTKDFLKPVVQFLVSF